MTIKTPRKAERPILWIIAGPNGCGKSSLYGRTDIEGWGGSAWIINPDLLTQSIVEQEALLQNDANLEAVRRIERWLYTSVDVYQTIGVETVLSSGKYRALVKGAKLSGFHVRMIFVVVSSVELQISRVRLRVEEGGHDVPADKIAARRLRSFEQLAWFYRNVDECYIYDNSTGEPKLLAEKMGPALFRWGALPSDMQETLELHGAFLPPSNFV